MRKIILLLICATFVLSCFPAVASSASESQMTLVDEIKANIPGFDPDDYPLASDEGFHILGTMEQGLLNPSEERKLYVYAYNPSQAYIRSVRCDLNVTLESEDGRVMSKTYGSTIFSLCNQSDDRRFLCFSFSLNKKYTAEIFSEYGAVHRYSLDEVKIFRYSDADLTKPLDTLNLNKTETYIFKPVEEKGSTVYQITAERQDLLRLDVEVTTYKTPFATTNSKTHDQIASAYFSVPDQYARYYKSLYSITSSYRKNRLENLLFSDTFFTYGPQLPLYFISSDYNSSSTTGIVGTTTVIADNGNLKSYPGKVYDFERFVSSYYGMHVEDLDAIISSADVYEIIKLFEENEVDFKLSSSVFYPSSTKTVDQSWDSISYYSSASFSDYWSDYGFWSAVSLWWYRDVLGSSEAVEKYLADRGYVSDGTMSDQPYLVLIDAVEKLKISELSDAEVSDTYLIGLSDVPAFREYISTHKNVVLYRFDIDNYYCDRVNVTNKDYVAIPSSEDQANLVDITYYEDFIIKELTFRDDDTYISVGVTSDPQAVVPDVEYIPEDDSINTGAGLKNTGKDIMKILRYVLVIIGVIFLLTVIFNFSTVLATFASRKKRK